MKRVATLTALLVIAKLNTAFAGPEEDFVENLAKWRNANITTYSITFTERCDCQHTQTPYRIRVENSIVRDVVFLRQVALPRGEFNRETFEWIPREFSPGDSVPLYLIHRLRTIDALFNEISTAISESADAIDIEYNLELGYPEVVKIDYLLEGFDEELEMRVSDFVEGGA